MSFPASIKNGIAKNVNESAEANALNGAIKYGADYLIIEVNERTIEKGYVKNIPFDIRAITNIIPSHNTLLYTPEQYVAIKKSFFQNIPAEDECTCIYGLTNKDLFYEMISLNNNKYKTFASEYVAGLKGIPQEEINYMLHPNGSNAFDTLDGLNFNQGSESVVSFWIAYLAINPHAK